MRLRIILAKLSSGVPAQRSTLVLRCRPGPHKLRPWAVPDQRRTTRAKKEARALHRIRDTRPYFGA